MSDSINWGTVPEVDIPVGGFVGWGNGPGQVLTGEVLGVDNGGGTDLNGKTSSIVTFQLLADFVNYKDRGSIRETLPAGEVVRVNASQAQLAAAVKVATPRPGDCMRIELAEVQALPGGKTLKKFKIQHVPAVRPGQEEDPW